MRCRWSFVNSAVKAHIPLHSRGRRIAPKTGHVSPFLLYFYGCRTEFKPAHVQPRGLKARSYFHCCASGLCLWGSDAIGYWNETSEKWKPLTPTQKPWGEKNPKPNQPLPPRPPQKTQTPKQTTKNPVVFIAGILDSFVARMLMCFYLPRSLQQGVYFVSSVTARTPCLVVPPLKDCLLNQRA